MFLGYNLLILHKFIIMDPEKREPANEKQEKLKKIDALLNPTFANSGMLYEKIDETIYSGEKDYAARRVKIEACGYDSDNLAEIGQGIRTEYADLYEKIRAKDATPEDTTRFNHLQGLIFSQTESGETGYSQHSDISIGLAHELVRQMRKANNFLAQPDTDEETVQRIFSERKSDPAREETINGALDNTKGKFEAKKKAALSELTKKNTRHKVSQYETAFDVLESAIQPKEPSFSNQNRDGVKGRLKFGPEDLLAEKARQRQEEAQREDLAKAAEEETRLQERMTQGEESIQQPNTEKPEPQKTPPQTKGIFSRFFKPK